MTAPSVRYKFLLKNGERVTIDNPQYYPDPTTIEKSLEPYVRISIIIPEKYMGAVMKLCNERRGLNSKFNYPSQGRIEVNFDMPLAEIVYDFYDKLKTITQGYGSFDYDYLEHREGDLTKVDMMVNHEKVDALSIIVHRDNARARGLHICNKLKEEIPRQMFKIIIQSTIGGNIIARSTINPFRKDVTAKCYGGDISRKRKLLEKQKKGKEKMKMVGSVEIPQKAFVSILKSEND
jgi:GTP-binding protein LepA